MMMNIIERFEKILPSIIYSDDQSLLWNNEYQRKEIAKLLAIQGIEERIRELELIRGDKVFIYKSNKTIEERILELKLEIDKLK